MRGNSYKKYRKEPQIKIGSKKENVLYSEKNIDPELNFFNKQLSREEFASNMRRKNQKEEFSTLSKNFQDNYMGPPNLAHQRIDFDNVSGKIGQEKREMDINKYQQQPSFAKDQVYNTYINNDREKNNKKYYHNIINNTIFGFCDPSMKYPKTSYQSNYQGNDINEQLKYLSQRQYEDYLRFRKEQIEIMNKGNLGKNLRELPPRKKRLEKDDDEILNRKEIKEMREQKYKEQLDNLIKEQRLLDQNQARTLNPSGYIPTPEEYELYLQQQKNNALNSLNKNNIKTDEIPIKDNKEIIDNKNMVNNNIISPNEQINEKFYTINNNTENYQEQQKRKYTPENINQYRPQFTPKEEFDNYGNNFGNEVPKTYEDYQRLMEKEKFEREKMFNEQQIKREREIPKNEEEYNAQMAQLAQMEFLRQNNEMYQNEDKIKEIQRKEAEEEYLKNVKKYEDIIQDNPEQRFKLPPPPFGSNNIPSLNKMSIDSQLQGASTGFINQSNKVSQNPYSINNYSLGDTNLSQNPIVHPVNSYQFDYNRLYNPLINKKK